MIQIISVIFTIVLVSLILYKYKEPLTPKKITLTGIFLSLALVMTLFSMNLLFFGGQVVIRFSQVALIVLAAALGPVYGLLGSIGFDVLNLMIYPLGSFYFGFTLSNIMVTVIPALIFQWLKHKNSKVNFSIMIFTGLSYILYIIIVLMLALVRIDITDLSAKQMTTNIIIFMCVFLVIFIGSSIYMKRKGIHLNNDLVLFITSAILVEFIVQGFLTPLWLYDVAKTPIIISMQIRAIKGIVMVPINTFVGYPIYRIVQDRFISR